MDGNALANEERNQALLTWYPMVQRLAHRAATSYGLPAGVETADLVSCGVLGLAEAWDRFDASRGVAFDVYAIPRVRGAIIDAIRAGDWVPRKARQKARETGTNLMLLISLDAHSDGDQPASDRLADESELPGDDLAACETRRELMGAINRLPERERLIVTLRYFEGTQLAEIASRLGVTESRVSQLHARALRMLKSSLDALEALPAPSAA
ncbi:MAG TPA: sigma-70 family RNA polymerase sigma factor [Actinomycetota bacterium]|jgi:RNA polymerase sigma factor for flagellar operon FliA|nr:sigma-70 family RNA polymerase sigma factor [Actinomycetota bacterium]